MTLIDLDKFLVSFITEMKKYQPVTSYNLPGCIRKALKDQGFKYKDGEVVRISDESEDERIRKSLIDGFTVMKESKNCGKTFSNHNIPVVDILAWLEKQGEHANFRNKIQIGDKVTRNRDGVLVNLSQLNRVAKKDEKQGEQKPIEWSKLHITIGTKIRSKANPDLILSIISNDCHEDEFECSNGSVLSLKQIEKYYDIIS